MVKTLQAIKAKMVQHGYQELVIDEPLEVRPHAAPGGWCILGLLRVRLDAPGGAASAADASARVDARRC